MTVTVIAAAVDAVVGGGSGGDGCLDNDVAPTHCEAAPLWGSLRGVR